MRGVLLSVCLVLTGAGCGPEDAGPPASELAPAVSVSGVGGKGDSFAEDPEAVWATIIDRCGKPAADEPVVYSSDFEWGYTLESMAVRYDEIYVSGKRLADRAHYDEDAGGLVLPGVGTWGGDVALPTRLVENVTLHIEHALEAGYVDFVFFPDMGHSHLFIPEDLWAAEYQGYPVAEISRRYERMFDDPELMMLYHTAEQLEMLDENGAPLADRRVQWRYNTRNLVGDNNHERRLEFLLEVDSPANTSRDMAGYHYYGAGFNVSASEQGCFPFEVDGELQWYDISLSDLPYPPGTGGGDF